MKESNVSLESPLSCSQEHLLKWWLQVKRAPNEKF